MGELYRRSRRSSERYSRLAQANRRTPVRNVSGSASNRRRRNPDAAPRVGMGWSLNLRIRGDGRSQTALGAQFPKVNGPITRTGLESVQVDIVMTRTPDGHGRLELTKFRNPKLVETEPPIAPPNTLGFRSIMFTVENVDDTVARLHAYGAELVSEVPSTRTSTDSATCEALRALCVDGNACPRIVAAADIFHILASLLL
jgi:Glyoxalase/Bleomycin resistance protein/Dioxygenase superfamily